MLRIIFGVISAILFTISTPTHAKVMYHVECYYVSVNGDQLNDGCTLSDTPQEAVAKLRDFNWARFNHGPGGICTYGLTYRPPAGINVSVSGVGRDGSCTDAKFHFVDDAIGTREVFDSPIVKISGNKELRPAGTQGVSTTTLVVKVTVEGQPQSGVRVGLGAEAIASSGGHNHHDASRPQGQLVPDNGVTDANGELKVVYKASEFAGTHIVSAACKDCTLEAPLAIEVKVPDLVELPANPSKYTLIGTTTKHISNHYLTESASRALLKLIETMLLEGWTNPGVNDASLKWGGLFDIGGGWKPSHHEHREGNEVDISFYRPAGVSDALRQKVFDKLKNGYSFGLPQVLWHLKDNPSTKSFAHFHVYLLAQKASFTKPY